MLRDPDDQLRSARATRSVLIPELVSGIVESVFDEVDGVLGELELLSVIDESEVEGVEDVEVVDVGGLVVVSRDQVASGVRPVVPVELPVGAVVAGAGVLDVLPGVPVALFGVEDEP